AWDPEDSLMVPLAHAGGRMLGILSIDEPLAGRLPTDDELELVVAMAAQAARAIDQLQRHKEMQRHRAALEHLHEVSTRLSSVGAREDVLDAVAQGIGRALGFDRMIACMWAVDPSDRRLPSAEKLPVLRMFANQAVTALELARRWAAEQEANELMRATVTSSPLAIIRIDRDGVVRGWNAAAERLYGWQANEVLGGPSPIDGGLAFMHILAPV